MTTWEQFFDQKIKDLAKGKEILDVGGASGFIKILGPYKHEFKNSRYRSMDISPESKPDVVGDIHDIPFPDETFDGVLCISVLEHVHDPERAMREIYRILKKEGKCLIYVPFLYAYHAREGAYEYKDYYRYSKDGLAHLGRFFSHIKIVPVKLFFETWFFLLPNPFGPILARAGRILDVIFKPKGNQTSGHYIYLVK